MTEQRTWWSRVATAIKQKETSCFMNVLTKPIDKLLAKVGLQRKFKFGPLFNDKWKRPLMSLSDKLLRKQGLMRLEWHDADLAEQTQWLEDRLKNMRSHINCEKQKLARAMETVKLLQEAYYERDRPCDMLRVTMSIDSRMFDYFQHERTSDETNYLVEALAHSLRKMMYERGRSSAPNINRMHRGEVLFDSPRFKMPRE